MLQPAGSTIESLPDPPAVMAELERLAASHCFRKAERCLRLLRYITNVTLAGRGAEIKEYALGVTVLDRPASYDPRTDPVVRLEARRLRLKLAEYYQAEGLDDPVVIDLPKGGYVPDFRLRPVSANHVITVLPVQPIERRTTPLVPSWHRRAGGWLVIVVGLTLVSVLLVSGLLRQHQAKPPYIPRADAYEYYSRAQYALAHNQDSLVLFRKAAEIDPHFAGAQIGLAHAYTQAAANDVIAPEKSLGFAEEAAQTAIQLEPSSAEAHAMLGYIEYCRWKWLEADRQFRLATRVEPSNAESWRLWALVYFARGRFDVAEQTLKRAATLEHGTLKAASMLDQIYYYERRYNLAIEEAQRLITEDQNNYIAHWVIATSLMHMGRLQEAIQAWQPMLHSDEHQYWKDVPRQMAFYRGKAGETADLQAYIRSCRTKNPDYCSPWLIAQAYAVLNDRTNCLYYLREAAAHHDPDLVSLRWEPLFDSMRQEPEYQRVIQQLGF